MEVIEDVGSVLCARQGVAHVVRINVHHTLLLQTADGGSTCGVESREGGGAIR